MLSHFIYSSPLTLFAFTCYPPSPAPFSSGVLFVRFSRIFTVPLTPPVSITIAAPFSLIFLLWTIISGRLSPLFLTVFRFCSLRYLSFQLLILYLYSFTISLSFFHFLSFSASFSITILICIFYSNFFCLEGFYDIRIYLINDSHLKKNSCSWFCTYFSFLSSYIFYISHFPLITIESTLQITISHPLTLFSRDKRPD